MKNKGIFLCLIIGFFAGIVSGFFSSGGGLIILPFYISVLKLEDVKARATTIFCVVFITFISTIFYFNAQNIDLGLAIKCAIGGMVGSYIGTKSMNVFSSKVLNICLVIFLIYAGIKMII